MRRVVVPELLDSDAGTVEEVADSLQDLRWINKNFGGISTTAQLLRRVCRRVGIRQLTFLDVAGATGDVAEGVRTQLAQEGLTISTTLLDRSATHLPADGRGAVAGDALALPFQDGSFDVVGSALFIHHLEPKQVISFVDEALRVSRHACIINDLRRSRLHLIATWAGRLFYRSRITSHDSAASVRRAYTRLELKQMLSQTSAGEIEFSTHFMFRLAVIVWKRQSL